MVLSPCIVPYAAPTSFERRFRATFPQLYRRLQDSSPGARLVLILFEKASTMTST